MLSTHNLLLIRFGFSERRDRIKGLTKNLDGFTVRLYQAKKQIKEQHYAVLRPKDYQTQDTVFTFKAPELGSYVMRIIPDILAKRDSESKFDVTLFRHYCTSSLSHGE